MLLQQSARKSCPRHFVFFLRHMSGGQDISVRVVVGPQTASLFKSRDSVFKKVQLQARLAKFKKYLRIFGLLPFGFDQVGQCFLGIFLLLGYFCELPQALDAIGLQAKRSFVALEGRVRSPFEKYWFASAMARFDGNLPTRLRLFKDVKSLLIKSRLGKSKDEKAVLSERGTCGNAFQAGTSAASESFCLRPA